MNSQREARARIRASARLRASSGAFKVAQDERALWADGGKSDA